jgi:hypothetical protein
MASAIIIPVNPRFSTTLNVELAYVSQAVEMINAFDGAHDAKGNFDFAEALQIAKNHAGFAVVGTITQDTTRVEQKVWVSIEQLQNLIQMVAGAATEDWVVFGAAARAFIDLDAQKNGGHLTILSQSSRAISYRYNMFQVTQNKSTGEMMCGQLSSVEIKQQEEEANFLALTAGSSTTVEMHFKSLVVVEQLRR